VLAKVNKTYLYSDELLGLLPSGQSEQDSIAMLSAYVEAWIEQQLILQDAGRILTAGEKDFSRKIREYRNALMVFEWERKILEKNLDTLVTEQEMMLYYEANSHEFVLQRDIVRVLYVKLNANSKKINDASQLIRQEQFDANAAEQFCRNYAVNYFLDVKSWLFVDDIQKEIPLSIQQKQEMSTGNAYIEIKDEEYIYMLKVLEVRLKGSVSPFALEENTIRDVILQKRKTEITDKYVLGLKQEAEKKSSIEVFVK